MILRIMLNTLYNELNNDLLTDLQYYLTDVLGSGYTITELITAFTNKYRRDNVLLTHVINLRNSRSIGDMVEFYELLELMECTL